MGIYDRDYYRKEGPSFLDSIIPDGRVCRWLIGLNGVIFILQLVFRHSQAPNAAALPPGLPPEQLIAEGMRLLFDPGPVTRWLQLDTAAVMHGEVWRLLTYAFVHDVDSFLHVAFNMLFLWWFGTDVEMIYGSREFLGFYLVAAFLGGLSFQVYALLQPGGQSMVCIGASGSITAVLVLCACHFPSRSILVMMLIPVPIWIFVIFSVSQDVYRLLYTPPLPHMRSGVAAIVHLAGAAFAFVYYKQQWRVTTWWPDFNFRWKTRRRGMRLYRPDEDREAVPVAAATASGEMDEHLEAKLDAVLEKVSLHGKDSLSDNERKILLRASEIYKRKRT